MFLNYMFSYFLIFFHMLYSLTNVFSKVFAAHAKAAQKDFKNTSK